MKVAFTTADLLIQSCEYVHIDHSLISRLFNNRYFAERPTAKPELPLRSVSTWNLDIYFGCKAYALTGYSDFGKPFWSSVRTIRNPASSKSFRNLSSVLVTLLSVSS